MNKNVAITLFVIFITGIIGFKYGPENNIAAESATNVIPRFVDVPRSPTSSIIHINLQKDFVTVSGNSENTTVTLTKPPVKEPEVKFIEIVKYIRVDDIFQRSTEFNKFYPIDRAPIIGNTSDEKPGALLDRI